jgi:small subunit ribosomal protein S2
MSDQYVPEGRGAAEETNDRSLLADGALRDPTRPLSVRELFDAGVHFGHQTRRWNPKMRPYLYGSRNGTHIIDLDQTVQLFKRAFNFVADGVARGGHVLFVGTKRQAQDIVREEAARAGQYYVVNRWLGGTLTNFRTIKGGLERLRTLERMAEDGTYDNISKKEISQLEKERTRFEKYIGGVKGMGSVPSAVFIIDPSQELIAVAESRKLRVPIVAITDSNCDPSVVDYPIPGNDDAIRSIRLITSALADACLLGASRRRDKPERKERDGAGGGSGGERGERGERGGRPGQPEASVVYRR